MKWGSNLVRLSCPTFVRVSGFSDGKAGEKIVLLEYVFWKIDFKIQSSYRLNMIVHMSVHMSV